MKDWISNFRGLSDLNYINETLKNAISPFQKQQNLIDLFSQKHILQFMNLNKPVTTFDALIDTPFWKIQNLHSINYGGLNQLNNPKTALSVAISGLSSNLIGYSKEYIDEALLGEDEYDEGAQLVDKLQASVDKEERITKGDLVELREFIQEKFEQSESTELKKEMRGYVINFLITTLFFLLSLQSSSDNSDSENGDLEIDLPNSEINMTPQQITYKTLDTLGLRKTTANVRLRTIPNTESPKSIIIVLPVNTYIHIIDNNKYWVRVRCDDPNNVSDYLEGWVSKKYIQNISADFFEVEVSDDGK